MKKLVGNQHAIKINKTENSGLYANINIESLNNAAQNLSAGAFKLWMYFMKNRNGYEFALSSNDAETSFGIKQRQYSNAMAELKEKKYLVCGYIKTYKVPGLYFYERPVEDEKA